MIYRLATLTDSHALAQLRWDFQLEFGEELPICTQEDFIATCTDFFRLSIANRSWHHFVAEDRGEIVAHVSLHLITKIPKPSELHGTIGYVTNTYTQPAYRNQGIGSRLTTQLITWAKKEHAELLIVWPSSKSVQFYEKNGFTKAHTIFEKNLEE